MRHDVSNHDETCSDVVANEVIADADVLGELVVTRVLRQLDGAFIVDVATRLGQLAAYSQCRSVAVH